jgi:arsenite methyltransferase
VTRPGKAVSMSDERDRWSEWLLRRRHGDDPERQKAMLEGLTRVRDGVLDRAGLGAGDTLLDVGCGDGLIGFGGLDRVGPTGRVIFSDVSQELLDLCRLRAVETGAAQRCVFVRSSADRLDVVAGESVDAVTTRSVLIYVADQPACSREFHRVLRRGGRLSIHEPINAFTARTGRNGRFGGYDIAPIADLAAKVTALYAGLQPPDNDPSWTSTSATCSRPQSRPASPRSTSSYTSTSSRNFPRWPGTALFTPRPTP